MESIFEALVDLGVSAVESTIENIGDLFSTENNPKLNNVVLSPLDAVVDIGSTTNNKIDNERKMFESFLLHSIKIIEDAEYDRTTNQYKSELLQFLWQIWLKRAELSNYVVQIDKSIENHNYYENEKQMFNTYLDSQKENNIAFFNKYILMDSNLDNNIFKVWLYRAKLAGYTY